MHGSCAVHIKHFSSTLHRLRNLFVWNCNYNFITLQKSTLMNEVEDRRDPARRFYVVFDIVH